MTDERQRIETVYAGYDLGTASSRWALDNPGYRSLVDERSRRFTRAVADAAHGIDAPCVLDLGCGTGTDLETLSAAVPGDSTLVGVELRFDALASAVGAEVVDWKLVNGDGTRLPFASGSFDIVVLATVLSSILSDDIRSAVSAEIERVLAPNGAIVIYDMRVRNPTNRNLRGVTGRRREIHRHRAAVWRDGAGGVVHLRDIGHVSSKISEKWCDEMLKP